MGMKEIITKIKLFLNEEISTETTLVDVKTTDGLILSFDALEVGKELFVVDQAGRTPAPDGEYILEDGVKIVAVDGLISEVVVVEEPEEEVIPVEDMPEEAPMMSESDTKLEELIAKVKKCEEDNLALAEVVQQLAENFSKMNFKEEVKMQRVKSEEKVTEKPLNKNNSNLDNIFKNMYK